MAIEPHLQTVIDRYRALIGERKYDDAYALFHSELNAPTLYGIGDICFQRIPLLEMLFGDGLDQPPTLSKPADQLFVLHGLGVAYNLIGGVPAKAVMLYQMHHEIAERVNDRAALSECMGDHAKSLRQAGHFRASEAIARRGLAIQRDLGDARKEAVNLYWLGMGLAHRGVEDLSEIALQRALDIFRAKFAQQSEGVVNAFMAQRYLWLGDARAALTCADRTWAIAEQLDAKPDHLDRNGIVKIQTASARMQGEAAMLMGDTSRAEERLAYTMQRAALINMVEEILPALRVLAELERKRGNFARAREHLAETWRLAEAGPYALYHADSYNILARIEKSEGNTHNAIHAATKAYHLAWCDGTPFAYQRGVDDARAILAELDAPQPDLPAYDDSRHPPMPDVEIDPA